MIFAVYVLAILVAALIWRDIAKEIKINDHRRDHNALAETVRDQGMLIEAQRLPDRDKMKVISSILDLMHPRKYNNGYLFTDENGRKGYITSTYISFDSMDPFSASSFSRHYEYFLVDIFEWPSKSKLTVSESFLESMDKAKAEALAECQAKKEPACKKNPRCKKSSDDKKKGGKKS